MAGILTIQYPFPFHHHLLIPTTGDCVESMALSDNVVRAGLTPKFRDVETLCSMLTYQYGRTQLLSPQRIDPYTLLYRPPEEFAEFEVEVCTLPPNAPPQHPAILDCGSIFLVFKGTTCSIVEGDGDNDTADVMAERVPSGSVMFLSGTTPHLTTVSIHFRMPLHIHPYQNTVSYSQIYLSIHSCSCTHLIFYFIHPFSQIPYPSPCQSCTLSTAQSEVTIYAGTDECVYYRAHVNLGGVTSSTSSASTILSSDG